MSGLNVNEKQLLRVAAFEVSWLSGNAVAEACQMKKADLYREIISNYMNTIDSIDFNDLSNRYSLPIRDGKLPLFRELMKQGMKEGKHCLQIIVFHFQHMYIILTYIILTITLLFHLRLVRSIQYYYTCHFLNV